MVYTLQAQARLAVEALEAPSITGWVYVEYLRRRIGLSLIPRALGREEGEVERHGDFSSNDLAKLDVLCRISAAFTETYEPTHVLVHWLIGCNPLLGELSPIEVIASSAPGTPGFEHVLQAARSFVTKWAG